MGKKIHQNTCWKKTSRGTALSLYSNSSDFNLHRTDSLTPPVRSQPVLFIGGVHGDEPEGVRLAQDWLSWLQKNNNIVQQEWFLVPCLNVDGFAMNQRTNANGVDLNRNFPTDDWSPVAKSPRYHPGSSPGSEYETQAVCELIEQIQPSLIVHFHSWEPCVVYTGSPGKFAAELLAAKTPYQARPDIGYPTPGSLGKYGWSNCQVPVICIEAQEYSDLNSVWPIFKEGLMELIQTKGSLVR